MSRQHAAHERRLREAIAEYNLAERAELVEEGLTWLGLAGPIYRSGPVRMRALAIDVDGVHWVDACLAAESAYFGHPIFEYYSDRPGGQLQMSVEIWQVSLTRGRFSTILGRIADVCDILDLDAPETFPADNWARSYDSWPDRTDEQMMRIDSVPAGGAL
jgi:hypothetical protein